MEITFYKYQGTGNDFVIIDNRKNSFPKDDVTTIHKLCHRNFGIGADGLILLEEDTNSDFKMVYYNADGNESSMCGNGGRCIVAFAHKLGLFDRETTFTAIDGLHYATIEAGIVALQMIDVTQINLLETHVFTDTGSPHHVEFINDVTNHDVYTEGKRIRTDIYGKAGSNVNFVQQLGDSTFKVRTYERGVEDETLACGTGVTAVAIAAHATGKTTSTTITLPVEGGELEVSFSQENGSYTNVFLKGPATFVFKGTIQV